MRSKILAIIILSSFLIIPGIFYWYFFHQNTSSVTFRTSESGVEFDILLSGTFEYTYLPIADKALVFHEKCQSECTLVLPPVKYDVVLSSSGKEDIHENISLERGKTISVPVDFSQVFQFLPVSGVFDDETLMTASLQNANSSFSGKFFPVGIGMGSKIFTWREWGGRVDIGVLTQVQFIPIHTLSFLPRTVKIENSKKYFIIQGYSSSQNILSLDGMESIIFPYADDILLVENTHAWKVRTQGGVYTFENGEWRKNMRFTDYIDISPSHRIGYIDRNDTQKLSLLNLEPNTSYIIFLDRDTAKQRILKSGFDIQCLLWHEGKPAFLATDNSINIFEVGS